MAKKKNQEVDDKFIAPENPVAPTETRSASAQGEKVETNTNRDELREDFPAIEAGPAVVAPENPDKKNQEYVQSLKEEAEKNSVAPKMGDKPSSSNDDE